MNTDIKKILEYATFAPSGENCQPWKFIINGNKVQQYNLPERDKSLYSWGQRASYMANGAALENIIIAATNFGYTTQFSLFPNPQDINLVAEIQFINNNAKKDSLFNYIKDRCTNRKPYNKELLNSNQINELINSYSDENIRIKYTQDEKHKNILGRVGSVNEEVMLSNKYLHEFFFNHISWSKQEDTIKKIGFFIDTLELPSFAKVGFKFFSNWKRASLLNKVGVNKLVGKQNAIVNSAASGFGIITLNNNSPTSFVKAGMALEKLWLTATKLGLSLQPLTGVLFFMLRIHANELDKFDDEQIRNIKEAYNKIRDIFNFSQHETAVFMFRVGYGGKPTARSSKFSVDEIIEIRN